MKTIYDFLAPRDGNKPTKMLPELYKSPFQIRPDYLVCPLPVNFDCYRGCSLLCKHCYCRELDSTMYPAYWDGYDPAKVAPADMKSAEKILKLAASEKETDNLIVRFLRAGVPIHMGNKSEPLIPTEESRHHIFEQALKLFSDYGYDIWLETKSGAYWRDEILNILNKATSEIHIGISIIPNNTIMKFLEPNCDSREDRLESVEALDDHGYNVGIKSEPIMPTLNDSDDDIVGLFGEAAASNAQWITFFNYKTRRAPMARTFFEEGGYDWNKMYDINQDDIKWGEIGKRIFRLWKGGEFHDNFNLTSADIFTFPLEVNGTCCCGADIKGYSKVNFQHVVELIKSKGSCSWKDIKSDVVKVLPEEEVTRFRKLFLDRSDEHYTLYDCPEFKMENGTWRKRQKSEFHGWAHLVT